MRKSKRGGITCPFLLFINPSMKTKLNNLILIVLAVSLILSGKFLLAPDHTSASAISDPRRTLSMDADWRFKLGDDDNARNPEFDDASWRKLDVPHDWSIE